MEKKFVLNQLLAYLLKKEICLAGITYKYLETPNPALIDVSIKIKQGESVGFIGPSGSGKSTLVDIILGLLTPDSGRVLVDGQDIQKNIHMLRDVSTC